MIELPIAKTRHVDIIVYHDDKTESWQVAVNLPGVDTPPFSVSPKDGRVIGQCLQGILWQGFLLGQARSVDKILRCLVAEDLLPEVGRQLVNMANMAEQWQEMANRDNLPVVNRNQPLM